MSRNRADIIGLLPAKICGCVRSPAPVARASSLAANVIAARTQLTQRRQLMRLKGVEDGEKKIASSPALLSRSFRVLIQRITLTLRVKTLHNNRQGNDDPV